METILAAIDFTPASRAAAGIGFTLARAANAELILFHVAPPGGEWDARVKLEKLAQSIERAGVRLSLRVGEGDPATVLRRVARVEAADLIVAGTHGRKGIPRLVLGSVAESLVRHAACPVMVVHGASADLPAGTRPRVLAAVDLATPHESVVAEAGRLARLLGGRVELLHAVPTGSLTEATTLSARLRRCGEPARSQGVEVTEHLLDGDPAEALLEAIDDFQASHLVMGTRGREGARRLLFGSVAETVLRRARCPVLVVRQSEPALPLAADPIPVRLARGLDGLLLVGEVS